MSENGRRRGGGRFAGGRRGGGFERVVVSFSMFGLFRDSIVHARVGRLVLHFLFRTILRRLRGLRMAEDRRGLFFEGALRLRRWIILPPGNRVPMRRLLPSFRRLLQRRGNATTMDAIA